MEVYYFALSYDFFLEDPDENEPLVNDTEDEREEIPSGEDEQNQNIKETTEEKTKENTTDNDSDPDYVPEDEEEGKETYIPMVPL